MSRRSQTQGPGGISPELKDLVPEFLILRKVLRIAPPNLKVPQLGAESLGLLIYLFEGFHFTGCNRSAASNCESDLRMIAIPKTARAT